jgi:hypothetical protein
VFARLCLLFLCAGYGTNYESIEYESGVPRVTTK